ncbi:hypothetical protein NOV72_00805 [Caballeronia novacaledonica]|uniref:Uncharacterized protein n=1 Tax=Caballeronia novacaledonica TaxID=1544861 RepID=A0A2U3I0B8_9BURK|nr:hypothetical protein NOV72_00805 [Caballeronia novacaledonica]
MTTSVIAEHDNAPIFSVADYRLAGVLVNEL